jgi:endonuclease G
MLGRLGIAGATLLLGAAGAAERTCLARFDDVGLPRHTSVAARVEQFRPVICRRGYALSFNLKNRTPDWVIERLSPGAVTGGATRSNRFRPDPALGALSPQPDDYTRSGYDRGHQAPAADARGDQQTEDESFYMSNMAPQVGPGFNRGEWAHLEDQVRRWIGCGHADLIVITGPIYGGSQRSIGAPPIRVPDAFYKIVFDERSREGVGFRLENRKYANAPLDGFSVPIRRIERETGLDFFPALRPAAQENVEAAAHPLWRDSCPVRRRARAD